MSKAIVVTEMPKNCSKCPYCDGDGWCYLQEQYIDVEENKERDFCCPLKPYSDFIPIEWIKKYMDKVDIEDCGMVYLSPSGPFRDMLEDWRAERGADK